MSDLNISITKPINFESLTILICHLLIGGEFRVAHMFNDPNWTDSPSVSGFWCADKVLWQESDINSSSEIQNNRILNYKTLELIFLHSPKSVQHVQEYSQNYRIFICIKNDTSSMDLIKTLTEYKRSSAEEFQLLIYHIKNESTAVYLPQSMKMDPIYIQNPGLKPTATKSRVIYRKLTAEIDKMWLTGASYPSDNKCLPYKVYRTKLFMFISKLFANFFYDRLKMDFVQHTQFRCPDAKKNVVNVRHEFSTVYRELSKQSIPLDNATM